MGKGMKQRINHTKLEDVELKRCSRCLEPKPLDYFGKDRRAWDSLCLICKECRKAKIPVKIDTTKVNSINTDTTKIQQKIYKIHQN